MIRPEAVEARRQTSQRRRGGRAVLDRILQKNRPRLLVEAVAGEGEPGPRSGGGEKGHPAPEEDGNQGHLDRVHEAPLEHAAEEAAPVPRR